MRVLLAIDGSRSADQARDLVAALPWAADTHIRVVAAIGRDDEQLRYTLDTALDAAERDLARPSRTVDRFLLAGRAATAIVEEAHAFGADLVVVGSRGHGPFQAMLLGSVSAEVVDHAPCPVLVVRNPSIGGVVLAEDGSASARSAADLVATWPAFAGLPVTVLSVAETTLPLAAGMAPGLYDEVLASYAESVAEARRQASAFSEATAERLLEAGVQASAVMLEGDAAHEIVQYAKGHERSLVVIGTRGHTGLARLVLGSVARNVLLHAPCSVLVVRAPALVERGEDDFEPDRLELPGDLGDDEGLPGEPASRFGYERPWTVGAGH